MPHFRNLVFLSFCLCWLNSSCQQITVSSGKIDNYPNFASKNVEPRDVMVWLPENYDGKKKFAVIYMHDGQMLFDSTTTWNKQEWKVDENLTALAKDNSLKQCIVVGIKNNGIKRFKEYFPEKAINYLTEDFKTEFIKTELESNALADKYLIFLTQELKPFIDKKYKTHSNQANTFIAGSSMGGLISMYAICEYPEIYGGAACLSTHWVGSVRQKNEFLPAAFMQYLDEKLPNPANHTLYFDFGTKTLDSLYEPLQLKADVIIRKKGYTDKNLMSKKFEGADHSENAWSSRLDIPFRFLLKK